MQVFLDKHCMLAYLDSKIWLKLPKKEKKILCNTKSELQIQNLVDYNCRVWISSETTKLPADVNLDSLCPWCLPSLPLQMSFKAEGQIMACSKPCGKHFPHWLLRLNVSLSSPFEKPLYHFSKLFGIILCIQSCPN